MARACGVHEHARAAAIGCIHSLLLTAGRGGVAHQLESWANDLLLCIHALAVDPVPNVRVLAVPALIQAIILVPCRTW